jgi:hypothetical protein
MSLPARGYAGASKSRPNRAGAGRAGAELRRPSHFPGPVSAVRGGGGLDQVQLLHRIPVVLNGLVRSGGARREFP